MRGKHLAPPPARYLSRSWIMPMALVLAMIMTSVAWADDLVNTLDSGYDVGLETVEIVSGSSVVVKFRIVATSGQGPGSDPGGCNVNASNGNFAELNITPPAGVTVTNGTGVLIGACDVDVPVTFSSSSLGEHSIVDFSVRGGRTNSVYTTDFAKFILKVKAPAPSDTTPPTITPSVVGTLGDNGWYTSDVTVTWTVGDPDSAVTSQTGCGTTTISADTAGQDATCSATSAGGTNSETVTIKRDATAPTFSCDEADTDWHGDNVALDCSAGDAMSGLADASLADFSLLTIVGEGADDANAATGSQLLVDKAGNEATAGPIDGNMIDRKNPSITLTVPAAGPYVLGSAVNADYSCDDGAGSGMASCVGDVDSGQAIDTASVGSKSFTVDATDNVGNTDEASVDYTVVYASGTCVGAPGRQVLQPINPDGSSVFKKGSTVPVKFRVCDTNGNSIGTPGVVKSFKKTASSSSAATVANEDVVSTTPDTAFRWSASDQQWIFNLSTKNLTANMQYSYAIELNDGTSIEFSFKLK